MNKLVWLGFLLLLAPSHAFLGGFLRGAQTNGDSGMMGMIHGILGTTADGCPNNFIKMPKSPCTCLSLNITVTQINYLTVQDYCMNVVDSRSRVVTFSNLTEMMYFENLLYPYKHFIGASNMPIGLYKSNDSEIRQLENNVLTKKTMQSETFNGKCLYFFPDDSNTNGCLQMAKSVACEIPCFDPPAPLPPTETQGSNRCNVANFNSVCPSGWISIGGICYMNPVGSNVLLNYFDALAVCNEQGGWLPSFSNVNEWTALTNYVFTNGISGTESWAAPMWLGGGKSENSTEAWDDSTPWTFSYWAPNEPNQENDCIWWSVGQGKFWSTGDCEMLGVAFCQYYKCPNSPETNRATSVPPLATTAATGMSSSSMTSKATTFSSATSLAQSSSSSMGSAASGSMSTISSSVTSVKTTVPAMSRTTGTVTVSPSTLATTKAGTVQPMVTTKTSTVPTAVTSATRTSSARISILTEPNAVTVSNATIFNDTMLIPSEFPII